MMDQVDRVICHSGVEYAEHPRALYWQGQRQEVKEILKRWRTPQGKGFRVLTEAGEVFDLLYEEPGDTWLIEMN